MKKEITHEEKLEFYKNYNSEEFQSQYKNIKHNYNIDGFTSNLILFCSAIALAFINPVFLIGILYPIVISADEFLTIKKKERKLIETINPNITYKDFKKLKHSYEWTLLGYELEVKEKLSKEENLKNIEKQKNKHITKIDNTKKNVGKNSSKETNLVRKANKRQTKQKIENKPRSLNCCIINNEEIKLTYSMLSDFAETIGCSLVEFVPSFDFEQTKTYIVKLKNNNKTISFEVSNNHFVGLYQYADTDLTAEWREYLEKLNTKSTNL